MVYGIYLSLGEPEAHPNACLNSNTTVLYCLVYNDNYFPSCYASSPRLALYSPVYNDLGLSALFRLFVGREPVYGTLR